MKRILVTLLITVGLCSANALAFDAKQQQKFADGLLSRGMYKMALAEYEKIIAESAELQHADVINFRMGEASRKLGEDSKAEAYYKTVSEKYPDSVYASRSTIRRAQLKADNEEHGEALALLSRALLETTDTSWAAAALYSKLNSLKALKQSEAFEATAKQILREHPESSYAPYTALELAGELLAQEKDASERIRLYQLVRDKAQTDTLKARAQWRLGEEYFQQGDYADSAGAYETLLSNYPDSPEALLSRINAAWAFLKVKNYRRCLPIIQQTPKSIKEKNPAAWVYLEANCYRKLGNRVKANELYEIIVKKHPETEQAKYAAYEAALMDFNQGDFASVISRAEQMKLDGARKEDGLWLLAKAYAEQEEFEKAIAHYNEILTSSKSLQRLPEALLALASLNQKLENLAVAEKQFVELVKKYPASTQAPLALMSAAHIASKENNLPQAITYWSDLITKYPQHSLAADAAYKQGLAHIKQEEFVKAEKSFARIVDSYADSAWIGNAWYWLVASQEQQGDKSLALTTARQAETQLKSPEQIAKVRYRTAVIHYEAKEYDLAADALIFIIPHAESIQPSPEMLSWLIEYKLKKGKLSEAEAAAKILTADDLSDALRQKGWAFLGQCYEAQNNTDKSNEAYEKATSIDLSSAEGILSLFKTAEQYAKRGLLTDAKALLEKAGEQAVELNLLEQQMNSYYELGRLAEQSGEYDEASRYYLSVAVLFDDKEKSPEALYKAATIFRTLGKESEAKRTINELKERYPESSWATKTE